MKTTAQIIVSAILAIFILTSMAFAGWPIPDSGQTKCYNDTTEITCPAPGEDFYGQDAQYVTPRSYIKLDASGNDLPDSATSWVMVRDNVTGLIWEMKTDDGSVNDEDNKYNWYDAQSVFIAELNSANFGGDSDWRLPTIKELASIANLGAYSPGIDAEYFPDSRPSGHWSSTADAYNEDYAWGVSFYYGYDSNYSKSSSRYVRAVRGGQAGSFDDLVINGEGTVTDPNTGLMWQQEGPDSMMTWKDALDYCEGLSFAGYGDWRLPSREELRSIVDYGTYNTAIDTGYFSDTRSSGYWSSTTTTYLIGEDHAWCVNFDYGNGYGGAKSDSYYVRCVRGGQARLNNPPVIHSLAGDWRYYEEGDGEQLLDVYNGYENAYVEDPDSPDFNDGYLTVSIINGYCYGEDSLRISMNGGISVDSSDNVFYNGTQIGYYFYASAEEIKVLFNSNSDVTSVSALICSIAYENVNVNNATPGERKIRFVMNDGDGGTSPNCEMWIEIGSPNNDPVITGIEGDWISYYGGEDPVVTDVGWPAVISDVDSPDFNGGALSVQILNGNPDEDVLGLVSGTLESVTIGSATFNGTELRIELNEGATASGVTNIIRNIVYENTASDPTVGTRTLRFILSDGDGGTSTASDMIVSVNSQAQNTVTLTKAGGGTGTVISEPDGINCGMDCSEQEAVYTNSEEITLTATPDKGCVFSGWSGHCTGKDTCILTSPKLIIKFFKFAGHCTEKDTCILTADESIAVTAFFTPPTQLIGDLNGDGEITPGDVAAAYELSKKFSWTEAELLAADFNGDGEITPQDAVSIYEMSKEF